MSSRLAEKRSRVEVFPVDTSLSARVHAPVLEVGSSMNDIVLSSKSILELFLKEQTMLWSHHHQP